MPVKSEFYNFFKIELGEKLLWKYEGTRRATKRIIHKHVTYPDFNSKKNDTNQKKLIKPLKPGYFGAF